MVSTKPELEFQSPVILRLADTERRSGIISDENVAAAVSALHRDGVVVLENAVDLEHVDKLNNILSSEAEIMANSPTTHFNDVGCLLFIQA